MPCLLDAQSTDKDKHVIEKSTVVIHFLPNSRKGWHWYHFHSHI